MSRDSLPTPAPRVAVLGHVEHITLGRVTSLPNAGDIVQMDAPRFFPGGGGGVAFYQVCKSPGEAVLFTALGNDEAALAVRARLATLRARIHTASRNEPHTRDVVMITP